MLGIWQWHAGAETFRVVLQRKRAFKPPDGSVHDVISSTHGYRSGSSNGEKPIGARSIDSTAVFTLFGFPSTGEKLLLSFHDITKNKQGNVLLQSVPGKPNELRWQLTPPIETVSLNRTIPASYTVPTTMLLTRVR
jgi:hypothetical protein